MITSALIINTIFSNNQCAGQASDVVLVPNINVEFQQVTRVEWDDTACIASASDIFTFDLRSDDNKPAFSFLTFAQVESALIPELDALLSSSRADKILAEEKEIKDESDKVAIEQYYFLDEAKQRWTEFMNRYNKVKEQVVSNKGKYKKINKWFHLNGAEQSLDNHFKGLVPQEFDDSKDGNFKGSNYTLPDNMPQDEFEKVHRIQFSGGAGNLEFSFSKSKIDEQVTLDGPKPTIDWAKFLVDLLAGGITNPTAALRRSIGTNNQDSSISVDGSTSIEFNALGATVNAGLSLAGTYDTSRRAFKGSESEKETSIELVLGDDDTYDIFTLDIYLDPDYETFIFDVRGGVSSCPW